jgi:MOSC domain
MWRGGRRVGRRQAPLQQDVSAFHYPDGRSWRRRRCALWIHCTAPLPGAPQSIGSTYPSGSPHSERAFRCATVVGIRSAPRSLGENIATVGLDLETFPLGTILQLGASATLELTGLRTPCVLIDRFMSGLKNRLQGGDAGPRFRAGVMAIVTKGGEVSPGDRIRTVLPALPHTALPPL